MSKTSEMKRTYGTAEAVGRPLKLVAGPLSAELLNGNLAAVRYKGIEVLRGISWLARDENWGTCPSRVGKITQKKSNKQLQLSYTAKASNAGAELTWKASITIAPGSLTFTVTAKPDKDFRTNRTGFVVLHPIAGIAGRPLTVTHTDGSKERSRFPRRISPGQPFFEIAALDHSPAPGLKAHVSMEGNKFEMEDQRNWGDASFKTYVCSLLDPWPYTLRAGETFTQTIRLGVKGAPRKAPARTTRKPAALRPTRLPAIGLSVAPEDAEATLEHVHNLLSLKPDFLSFFLDTDTSGEALQAYAKLAQKSQMPITVELVVSGQRSVGKEVEDAAKALASAGVSPRSVVITQSQDLKSFQPTDKRPPGPSFEELAQAARRSFPGAMIGGGMISFFTELNRKRPPQGVFDFVTHSICPIVHDARDAAVMQTLEALPHIFASAKDIIGKTPYHLGPTTIAARMNPYGADVTPNPKNKRICLAPNDPRQFGTFSVAWNKGLIEAAARAGIKRITLGGLCGPRGLLDSNGKPTPLFRYLESLQLRKAKQPHAPSRNRSRSRLKQQASF